MKILFVDHPEADYLAGQIYLGLCQELGPENVIDYPFKKSFHGEVHVYPHVYETDPGSGPYSSWWKDADGVAMGSTPPFEWLPAQPGRAWSCDEVARGLSSGGFELVVLASPRRDNAAALRELVALVGRDKMPPLVAIDGEDYDAIRWDVIEEFAPRVYFKRELIQGLEAKEEVSTPYPAQRRRMLSRVRIVPLPLAPALVHEAADSTDGVRLDVYMPGGTNTPGGIESYRTAIRDALPDARRYSFQRLPFDAYLNALCRTRIAVAVRGHSQDSLRSWEMLACAGPLVMIQRHTLVRPQPFEHGVHCVHFDGPVDLIQAIRCYLEDEPARARIAAAGHAHLCEHHTMRARARYLLKEALA